MRKKLLVATILTITSVLLIVTGSASLHNSKHLNIQPKLADCVQCKAVDGCRKCVGGGDAKYCMTSNDCEACVEEGICNPQGDRTCITQGERTGINEGGGAIRLPEQTIREISAVHPRFAATLAQLNVRGIGAGPYKVRWTPVSLSASDVERYINFDDRSVSLSKTRMEEVFRVNRLIEQKKVEEILHVVTVERINPSTMLIKLQVKSSSALDAAYSGLELRYAEAHDSLAKGSSQEPDIQWHVY